LALELTPVETTVLHTSIERIAGMISASIAHHQREHVRELADLYQLALEDIVRIRDILGSKGVSTRPKAAPPNARAVGPVSVRDALLPADPFDNMVSVIEGAEQAA
jgi:hypothetical protein